MIRQPPRSTLFPYTTSSDLVGEPTGSGTRINRRRPGRDGAGAARSIGKGHLAQGVRRARRDRKSTRLNSSHANISYAVFCLKKKKKTETQNHSMYEIHHGPP